MNNKPIWCWVCTETDLLAGEFCMNTTFKSFAPYEIPQEYCPSKKNYECSTWKVNKKDVQT